MSGRTEGVNPSSSDSYFQKPSLDDMRPGTDTEPPLFRKPDLDETGRDIAPPPARTNRCSAGTPSTK